MSVHQSSLPVQSTSPVHSSSPVIVDGLSVLHVMFKILHATYIASDSSEGLKIRLHLGLATRCICDMQLKKYDTAQVEMQNLRL